MFWLVYFLLLSPTLAELFLPTSIEDIKHDEPKEADPKNNYFNYIKSLNSDFKYRERRPKANLPRPGGFTHEYERAERNKRSDDVKAIKGKIEKELGKPLELSELDTETNATRQERKLESTTSPNLDKTETNLLINDFIRFKRASDIGTKPNEAETFQSSKGETDRAKREGQKGQSESLQVEHKSFSDGSDREPRGATKNEWLKYPYQVGKEGTERRDGYDDNFSSSSENMRAPRVHFVTQRRLENVPPYFDRESRARELNKEVSANLYRNLDRDIGYFQPRFTRYHGPPPFYYNRYDPYYDEERERDRYPHRFYPEHETRYYNPAKPKRIIYYATLPEVGRTPPNVDLRDRYNDYRDRYNDDYPGPRDYYKPRRLESRYETKGHYPLKVSTDVNVREVKKTPEKRIYSEVDRSRYAFKIPPYQRN